MSAFKDQLEADIQSVFINPLEFAESRLINGVAVDCVVDSDIIDERKGRSSAEYAEGVFLSQIMIFVRVSDIPRRPVRSEILRLDDDRYIVDNVAEMNSTKAKAIGELPKQYAIKQKQVRQKVTTSKASKQNLTARVTWRGYALNLTDFNVRPGRPQPARRPILRAMIDKKSGFDPYHGAFLINTSRGIKAFRRVTNNDGRYPITGVWGPSIPQLLAGDTVREAIESRAREQLDKRLDHEVNRMLDRAFAGR